MITKCIALFNLLPTSQPHHWLIAADWLEENEKYIEANAFREGILELYNKEYEYISSMDYVNSGYGEGNGYGNGWGLADDRGSGGGYGNGVGGNSIGLRGYFLKHRFS